MSNNSYWNREIETQSWAEVELWQAKQVGRFVDALPARSSFYAGRLGTLHKGFGAEGASPDSITELPFVTKADLRDALATTTDEQPLGSNQSATREAIVQVLSSSGTTSMPMYYALTQRDASNWADAIAQVFYTCGVRPSDIVAHLVALPMVAGGLPYADGFRRLGATLAWLGGYSADRIIESIPNLHVSTVLATTSFGVYLADRFDDLGDSVASKLGVSKFVSGGEPGLGEPAIRRKIAEGWRLSHISEMMGLGDVLSALWGECGDASGMHFNGQRYVYVELIDPDTCERVPWVEAARGEAVYTTFDRDAMPALRYRSSDYVEVLGTSCSCGRTSPKIRCIGRTDDMLIYKGMNVFPGAVREFVLGRFAKKIEPTIRIWKNSKNQVRYDDPIPLEIEHKQSLEVESIAAAAKEISDELRSHFQVRFAVTLVPPQTIPRSLYKTALVQVR